jgi:phosphoglycolate phosphatase
LLWLYIERIHFADDAKVLHLAPERGIFNNLSTLLKQENYITADFEPSRYPFAKNCRHIDLTDMESWPSNEFDLILHVHVLEHVKCNVAYPLFHIHRMLKPTGEHLCVIPFRGGVYDECLDDIGDKERTRRFGQDDHVRKFGSTGISSHIGSLINLPDTFDATRDFPQDLLKEYNIPPQDWKGMQPSTVFSLRKHDYKLAEWN